jgi:protein-arginine kinase activator protein McsA
MGAKQKEVKEKPLEKMTATELRDVAKDIPEITGAHGMNKPELISAIKKARGIEEVASKKNKRDIRKTKKEIRALKQKREEALKAEDAKLATIYRRKISRLKKKTRQAA